MKNKWLVLASILMIFFNNPIKSQADAPDDTDFTWSSRIKYPDYLLKDFGLNLKDTTDMFYSPDKDKVFGLNNNSVPRIKVDKKSFDRIVNNALNGDEVQRFRAADSLWRINDTLQIPILEKMILNDPSITIECQSAYYLQKIHSLKSIPLLIKALDKNSIYIKLGAAEALINLGEKKYSFNALKDIWNKDDDDYKNRCIWGFQSLNTPESRDFLLNTCLNDKDEALQLDVAITFTELKYYDVALNKMKDLLSSKHKMIRAATMSTMVYYLGTDKSHELIENMLNDKDPFVRQYCKLILKKYYKKTIK